MENLNVDDITASESTPTPFLSQSQIETININNGDDITKMLSQNINLTDDNIIHEPTCLICSSPYRQELEEKWLEDQDFAIVAKILMKKSNIKVPKSLLENHMFHHLGFEARELRKVEYINKITRLSSSNLTTLDRINLYVSALTERLMGVNSIAAEGDLGIADVEKIKSTETAKLGAVLNQLLKLQANILGEMQKNGEVIKIPKGKFIQIFNEVISEVQTDKEKQVAKNILDRLEQICTDI